MLAVAVAWASCLIGAVLLYSHPGIKGRGSGVSGHNTESQGTWIDTTFWFGTVIRRLFREMDGSLAGSAGSLVLA